MLIDRTLAAALSLIFLATAGCSGLDEREAEVYERGRAASEIHNWAAADSSLSEVLRAEPDWTPAYVLRAKARFELGRFPEALEDAARAEASGDLSDEESWRSMLLCGRCWIEMGRRIVPDADFSRRGLGSEAERRARDAFVKANLTLIEAGRMAPGDYDVNLWRGYSLLRLENFPKALDVFPVCEKAGAGRWEHRFFSALAWEGLHKINTHSLEALFAIVAVGPRSEHAPVYEHLAAISPNVTPEVAAKIFSCVQTFADSVPSPSERVQKYLAETTKRHELEKKQAELKEISQKVHDLVGSERFDEAVTAIEAFVKKAEQSPELTRLLRETEETWSQVLEVRTEGLLDSQDRAQLKTALKNLEMARSLTNRVERLVALQQKITATQMAITRQDASRKLDTARDLLKAGKAQEVLEEIAGLSVDGLSDQDRNRYHFLRGSASFELSQWSAAVRAFAAIEQRNFEALDVLHGLALIRSGQEGAGVAMLANVPAESRNDDANRLLGRHFAERKEHRKAVGYLSALRTPIRADLEAHAQARVELGRDLYRQADYLIAAEELQTAGQIFKVHLQKRAPEVLLYLGNSYFRAEDHARAKTAYEGLLQLDLTASEREQCRELFLNRAQIHLNEKSLEAAYKDLSEFARLGGQVPSAMIEVYGRLVATYADYMPMDRIQYWNYTSTSKDYNYTLFVLDDTRPDCHVERKEAGSVSKEVWSREGLVLTKKVGGGIVKLPLNVHASEEALPFLEYESQGQQCTSEIVALNQTIELPGARKFTECLKVRVRRVQKAADGKLHSTKHIFYLAPGVGEVKQEIFRDDAKVSDIVLSDFAYRAARLGN